jgi:hypothetical protein
MKIMGERMLAVANIHFRCKVESSLCYILLRAGEAPAQ